MRTATPRIIQLTDFDFLVPSSTTPGLRHETTRYSCSCRGFRAYGKPGWTCRHIRDVREAYGNPVIRFPQQPAVVVGDSGEAA